MCKLTEDSVGTGMFCSGAEVGGETAKVEESTGGADPLVGGSCLAVSSEEKGCIIFAGML